MASGSPSLIVFGPQITLPPAEYLSRLRLVLVNNHRLRGLLTAVKDLPNLWRTLVQLNPELSRVPGSQFLDDINEWIDNGDFPVRSLELHPNVLLTPLTVIVHIIEYFNYLEGSETVVSHSQVINSVQDGGIQGFCVGFLAAIAVACSKNEEEIIELGTIALRIALCIGAYVDLDGSFASPPYETSCLTARWSQPVENDHILNILEQYPGAYISALTDTTSLTITVPKAATRSITRELFERNVSAKPIGLSGRFHSITNEGTVKRILELSRYNPNLRLPAAKPLVPLRSNASGNILTGDHLNESALRSILVEVSDWSRTIKASVSGFKSGITHQVIVSGMIDCIPRSVSKDFGLHVLNLNGLSRDPMSPGAMFKNPSYSYPDHAIAIIGMGCRFPGAKCVTEFWEIIRSGTSMLGELPHERFSTHQLRRSPGISGRFWGNFISDAEAFDHRFFKKSSREAASMDPQHRLALQVAYETLESSGYFSNKPLETDIGCYIGVAASDYEDNVGSHLPTAFSVTGAVRAFTSGKISHFFGWTGPSIVFDTACSSSAVAIHVACKAIQTGECSMALAGGVNVITSPTLHQNLAAANFISPTGASKPFDAKADGYCRGEGAGLVLLKKFSEVTKNENVLGVLVGSAVNQNNNSAPIVVPVSSSQSSLYRRVLSLANMESTSISFVEAHGPGTPKGDPIECQSIRQVFGEKHRKLYFGSVKGNIGHTEAASGVAALIKVILMIQHRAIPKQANFSRLNPSIAPLEPSNMEIPLTSRSWNVDFMAACINNYGAAGSNAAMIVTQPRRAPSIDSTIILLPKYPILISAHSLASVRGFCTALKSYVDGKSDLPEDQLLASIAFNLAHRQNRSLDYSKATAAMSLEHLSEFLDVGVTEPTPSAKPVVLVFGGQTGKSVSLSEKAFLSSVLLQHHLKQCDVIIRSMGFKGLFPDIFKSEPVEDVVEFHCMLFSLQYSCAMSWIDSGLDIATMIGHSFGQLTALCVAGSVSLKDSLKLIAGRASLIKDKWGPERGAMLSVELDIYNLTNLISSSGHKVEIACYNGPTSHVLVGTEEIISEIQEVFERRSLLKPIKLKRLQVTHGFHSEFTDAIMPEYVKLVKQLTFGKTKITLETCSKDCSWTSVGPELVAQQSRDPVYFGEAVRRIEERLGPCTWIEAGSATGATHIARRALNGSNIPHSFYPIDLGATDPMGSLADTTVSLWRAGINVQFWPFHHIQRHHYSRLNLPPYQFEKSRHWLTYIDRHEMTRTDKKGSTLLLFLGFRNSTQQIAEFFVDQADDLYTSCLQGHAVLGNALCPASLYVEIMAQAARFLRPEVSISTLSFEDLKIDAPLGFDPAREVRLLLTKVPGIFLVWEFALSSRVRDQPRLITQHAAGRIALADLNDAKPTADFVHRDRNIDKQYCEALLADADAAALQGSFVYKMFEKVVHYGSIFRGVKRISMRRKEVAGQVAMPASSKVTGFVCNPFAIDNFTQVAGLHVNSLESCKDDEVFVCTRIGQLQVGHTFDQSQGPWLVYSAFEQRGERQLVNDIFVFDPNHKTSVMKILDVQFNKIVINSLRKALSKANPGARLLNDSTRSSNPSEDTTTQREPRRVASTSLRDTKNNQTALAVRRLLSDVADIPMKSITDDTSLEEIGIDSLMATEALSEIKKTFDISISPLDFADLSTCKALCSYIGARNNVSSPHSSSEPDSVLDLLDTQTLDTPGTPGSLAGGEIPNEEALKLWKLVAEYLDVKDPMSREFILASAGLDSLLGIELENAVEKEFGVKIDITQMKKATTFGELNDMIFLSQVEPQRTFTSKHVTVTTGKEGILNSSSDQLTNSVLELKLSPHSLRSTAGDFAVIRGDFSRFAEQTGFTNFRRRVYPKQAQLVLSYAVETFAALGCPLDSLKAGEKIASVPCIPRHKKVLSQLYKILEDAALVNINDGIPVRTAKSINGLSAKQLYREILTDFPEHACEHRLLNSTGSKLADIVSGKVDPLQVLFGTKSDRDLLEEVYTHSPMFATGTLMLGNFLSLITNKSSGSEKLRILEIGAGTGGTTKLITELLLSKGVDFTYMFTDLSSSMVLAAKRKFAHHDCMEYMVLDIEREPPEKLLRSFHIIISSNCIHATRSILNSSINLRMMLRDDGFLCLLELTRSLFWLDCVFGMLEGWWLFEDGRKHILANEFLWERTLLEAGFKHVDWTDDETEESDQFRIIAAFLSKPQHTKSPQVQLERTLDMETVEFTKVEEISLCADIYYPSKFDTIEMERPIALMIHGGGHIMLSRKDVRAKQTKLLLDHGLLPVSVDYRLCPEITLTQGPIPDVRTALQWARHTLPTIRLQRPDIRPDGNKVVVVGWSTGGTLALTLAWTAPQIGLKPPEAILAFYCPTDYESDFWRKPNIPVGTESLADGSYDLLEGVQGNPITGYNIPTQERAVGGWLSKSDPRSRIALHMNWKGQTLPIILGGLPNKSESGSDGHDSSRWLSLPQPSPTEIASVSPYAQIISGTYRTPTFLIHGTKDDLIPWEHSLRFRDALLDRGVAAGIDIVEGGVHLFDLYHDPNGKYLQAILRGYEFLFSFIN